MKASRLAGMVVATAIACTALPVIARDLEKIVLSDAARPQLVDQFGPKADRIRDILSRIRLPDGFTIKLYAMVPGARHMAVGPQGYVVFVGTARDRMWAVIDRDGEHVADDVARYGATIAMTMPHGVCFSNDGSLYLAERNRVLMFPNAEYIFTGRQSDAFVVVPKGGLVPADEESSGHSTRVCRIGPDGKLYISLGQPHNVSPPSKTEKYMKIGIGGIIRMNRDGTDREVFATGLRNSVGIDFNPANGDLWFTDNQVDRMGDTIPPGELNRATGPGGHFGFPWYGGGLVRTEEYMNTNPPPDAIPPQVEMDAHAADLGLTFYTGDMFPARYRGAIFSAQHGSWDRSDPVGARVMVTFLDEQGNAASTEPFAEGWLDPSRSGYLGRPVDVAPLPDGSLLVSDDQSGAIYRISYGE